MSDIKQITKPNVYFDYTAGRGSYDEEYNEEPTTVNQYHTSQKELKCADNEIRENNNRISFGKFSENQPKRLNYANCNQYQEKRRFSYSRGQNRGRAAGRSNFQYSRSETTSENSFHYSNQNISDNKNHISFNPKAVNWSPTKK